MLSLIGVGIDSEEEAELTPGKQVRCDVCGQSRPSYNIVNSGSPERGYKQLCGRCFNSEVAKASGLQAFEQPELEPVVITDCSGEPHEFHFRIHLFVTGVALDAFELRNGTPAGYQFQIIGDPKDDLLMLFAWLIEKMRRALSIKHLTDGERGLQIGDAHAVRGRIEWDAAEDGHLPLLVIDGREVTWDEFGRMLMTFEGFQFKLNVADKSEEL